MSRPKMIAQSSQTGHSKNGNSINGNSSSSDSADEDQISIRFADWGFKIDRLFEVANRFYKRNESKAFHPSFDERNKMIALIMQARYGNHDSGRAPDVGVLDFVGQRRQYEWSMLSGMSKTEAMSKFICALDHLCPLFKAHAEAVKISSGILEGEIVTKSSLCQETSEDKSPKVELDPQMHNIYSSLCKQTYNQFKSYAEKQYPDDMTKQRYLITSLQEQYYQQYISQMHPELKSSLPIRSEASNHTNSNLLSSLPSPAISDRSFSNNESIMNNDGDLSMIPENQPSLAPTVPQLELPPPPIGIHMSVHKTEQGTDTKPDLENINDSIYPGDSYCDENNVQADISSEELNSDPSVVERSLPHVDTVDGSTEFMLSDKMKCVSIQPGSKPSELRNGNIKEAVRLFRHSDLPPIGVFESFPDPKPIKSSSQKSTPIDQINPNLPLAFSEVSERCETSQKTQFMANFKESPSSQQVTSLKSVSAPQRPPEQTLSIERSTEINHDDRSHPTAPDEHMKPHSNIESESFPITVNEQVSDSSIGNIAESPKETCHGRGPELWDCGSGDGDSPRLPEVISYQEPEQAIIWTKKEIAEFKESLENDKQGGVYEVKESTLVIFEVPTYPDGKYIYWEFATDDFDIGFGLEFVYEQQLSQPLALNIYEDADEEDMDDMLEEDWSNPAPDSASLLDPESGCIMEQNSTSAVDVQQKILLEKRRRQRNTITIVPTYRRNSDQEVFVGRHKYPGRGYYLLRFDNTYSVLRSKTLYFRICYFM